MSVPVPRTRRRFSVEFKQRVVSEASVPGVSVSAVARRYDLNANQVFNWRRRYGGEDAFLPVTIAAPASPVPLDKDVSGEIEIALSVGHRVRIRGGYDADRLARLLLGLCR